jgi:outer membrane protein OmpA-like peptidoglycan-associated protein
MTNRRIHSSGDQDLPIRVRVVLVTLLCLLGSHPALAQESGGGDRYDPEEIQAAVMGFADSFAAQLLEGTEKLAAQVGTPEALKHADRLIFGGMSAAFDIASSPNPGMNLLDMMVLVSLNNIVWKEYWGPKVYGNAAQPMIDALSKLEEDIWDFAGKVMNPTQLQEIRGVIRQWRTRNPNKQVVYFIRFSDFGELGRMPALEKAMQPGGMLAPVREAAVAAEEIRAMGDRALYLMVRMQEMMPRRFEMAVKEILRTPELRHTLEDISSFRESSERYAAVLETLPSRTQSIIDQTMERVSTERQAAINQLMLELAGERQLALEQLIEGVTLIRAQSIEHLLQGFGAERKALMAEVGQLVQRSEGEAMMTHIFVLATVLLLLYFLLRMIYRYATDRPPETWIGKIAVAALLVVAALPVIAAALIYVHYSSPASQFESQPFSATDADQEKAAQLRGPLSTGDSVMSSVSGRTIRGSETEFPDTEPSSDVLPTARREDNDQTDETVVETPQVKSTEVGMTSDPAPTASHKSITLNQEVMVLQALFPRSGVEIIPQFENDLEKLSKFLIDNPNLRVDIQGHTDGRGLESANQQLSEARAKAVAQFLAHRGVAAERMWVMGYGSKKPVASNDTSEGRSKNRRVEIRVIR